MLCCCPYPRPPLLSLSSLLDLYDICTVCMIMLGFYSKVPYMQALLKGFDSDYSIPDVHVLSAIPERHLITNQPTNEINNLFKKMWCNDGLNLILTDVDYLYTLDCL